MSADSLKSLTPLITAVIKLVASVANSHNGGKNTQRSFSVNPDKIENLIPVVYVAWAKFADTQTKNGDKRTGQPPGTRREKLKECIHVVLDALDNVADTKPQVGDKATKQKQTHSKGGGEFMKIIPVAAAKLSSLGQKLGDKSTAGPESKWNILADIPKLVAEVMAERQKKASQEDSQARQVNRRRLS